MIAVEARRHPNLATSAVVLLGNVDVISVPIPLHCSDGFSEAYYGRPEKLLDLGARLANSDCSFVDAGIGDRYVETLSRDFADGIWDGATVR